MKYAVVRGKLYNYISSFVVTGGLSMPKNFTCGIQVRKEMNSKNQRIKYHQWYQAINVVNYSKAQFDEVKELN